MCVHHGWLERVDGRGGPCAGGPAGAALVHVRRWGPIFIAGLCKAVDGVVYATIVTTAAAPEL